MGSSFLILAGVATVAIGISVIVALIPRLRRLLREAVEARCPVAASQSIAFASPGEKCLHIEGPLFTARFSGLGFELTDEATGRPVVLKTVWLRAKSSGFRRGRLLLKRCEVSHAGAYRLEIRGIGEGFDPTDLAIVFTKPYLAPMVALILGIVLSGMLVIAGIVVPAILIGLAS